MTRRTGSLAYGVAFALMTILAGAPNDADAETLKVASAFDATSMDPHGHAVLNNQQLLIQIYEPLVGRDSGLKLVPALAVAWEAIEPTRWRFVLRDNVKFHDGTSFTAQDVAFSLRRAARPSSNYRNYVSTIARVEVVGPNSVEVFTTAPDPILPDKLTKIGIMSEAWAKANKAEEPLETGGSGENFATRNANGTGPFQLVERSPGVRTALTRFDGWWGEFEGNVTEYVSSPIASAPTRVAALVSGAVDLVVDPPIQDLPRLQADGATKVESGPEARSVVLVLDQGSEVLRYSNVKDANPFKDIRVRQALYQSIDIDALVKRILRAYAIPAALPFPPGVRGYAPDLDTRIAYDPEAAKRLLVEAGYPDGFQFTLDCPNNRESICQSIVSMWAKIGVSATLNSMPVANYLVKVEKKDTSIFLLGIGSYALDAFPALQLTLLSRPNESGDGLWNLGYVNERINELGASIAQEFDDNARGEQTRELLEIYKSDVANIPLYHNVGAWAMQRNINVSYRADGLLDARFVTVK